MARGAWVSVLSIESLGVKLDHLALEAVDNEGFSTLHRVVGGETVYKLSIDFPDGLFQYSPSSRWG